MVGRRTSITTVSHEIRRVKRCSLKAVYRLLLEHCTCSARAIHFLFRFGLRRETRQRESEREPHIEPYRVKCKEVKKARPHLSALPDLCATNKPHHTKCVSAVKHKSTTPRPPQHTQSVGGGGWVAARCCNSVCFSVLRRRQTLMIGHQQISGYIYILYRRVYK